VLHVWKGKKKRAVTGELLCAKKGLEGKREKPSIPKKKGEGIHNWTFPRIRKKSELERRGKGGSGVEKGGDKRINEVREGNEDSLTLPSKAPRALSSKKK